MSKQILGHSETNSTWEFDQTLSGGEALAHASLGQACVAGNWSNTHKDGFSLFQFPNNAELRKKWIEQVQRTRYMWNGPGSERSGVYCSPHFKKDYFETSCLLAQSMGIKKKILLKPDAVPTIFPEPSPSQAAASHSSISVGPTRY